MKFIEQFNLNNNNENHLQFIHINIDEEKFQQQIVKSIFDDKTLYKYVTNYTSERMEMIEKDYPIKHLIELLKNLKKEYIKDFIPENIQKKICQSLKIYDIRKKDWKTHFDEYLNKNINGHDVISEIVLSKIIEDYLGADVLVTKLGLSTNTNMRVFGIDVVHYNIETNMIFFGESKLTNDIDLGIQQHLLEMDMMDFKLTCESKLFATFENNIRGTNEIKYKFSNFGRKLTMESIDSLNNLPDKDVIFNIGLVFFVAHGDCFDYETITKKIEKFKNKIKIKNVKIYCITLPIKSKDDFKDIIEEVIKQYE